MANPQIQDGFTRIANELFDAVISFKFSARQLNVLLAVMRKTYGYGKKSDDISLSQISDATGLARSHICAAINDLVAMNVITKTQGKYAQELGINKNYNEWKVLPKQSQHCDQIGNSEVTNSVTPDVTESVTGGCYQIGNEVLPNRYISVTESVTEVLPNRSPQKKTPKETTKETTKRKLAQPPASPAETDFKVACRKTLDAYTNAYFDRYGIPPVTNAKLYSQVQEFVKRIGREESPHISGWFVGHTDAFYVRGGHTFGLLTKDAEKLRTEWATGRRMNGTKAKQVERAGGMADTVNEILQERGMQ